MNITLIYGSQRHGSTWHIAQKFVSALACGGEIREIYLPDALPVLCTACGVCLTQGARYCPHRQYTAPIVRALDQADLVILASEASALHVTGAMKNLLDHLVYRWMEHRPSPTMFTKTALALTTAPSGSTRAALKDMTDSLSHWGVGAIRTYGRTVHARTWEEVSPRIRREIDRGVSRLSAEIGGCGMAVVPSAAIRQRFYSVRLMHRLAALPRLDRAYWGENGWLGRVRPWDAVSRAPEDLK